MATDRFHQAAKDGLLDLLKDITRKEANAKDNDSMTPVLWAAFEGQLEALRFLCGRGGDPDKSDQFGNTALHLAAAKGHLHCVDFLIKFGVNLYALDIDRHGAKDLAAINNRDDILRYLDSAASSFEINDRKKAKALKELAEKNCEKRMREYLKRQPRQSDIHAQQEDYGNLKPVSASTGGMLSTLKQKIWSSQGNLNKCNKDCPLSTTKFSELVGTRSTGGSIASRTSSCTQRKSSHGQQPGDDVCGFKISEIEPDGRRTVSSTITGLQRDSEVLYAGTFSSNEDNNGRRGKISNIFEMDEANSDGDEANSNATQRRNSTLSRSVSHPNFQAKQLEDEDEQQQQNQQQQQQKLYLQRPGGSLFDRPMLGSIAFRQSVTAGLSNVQPTAVCPRLIADCDTTARSGIMKRSNSNKPRIFPHISDSDDADDSDGGDEDDQEDHQAGGSIQRFLTVWGLSEYLSIFQKQQIDLDTLMLLTESDLKSLGLPLGPFRKLAFGIQERRNALNNPGSMQDSRL